MGNFSDEGSVPMEGNRRRGVDVILGVGFGDKFIDGAEFPFERLAHHTCQALKSVRRERRKSAEKHETMRGDPILQLRSADRFDLDRCARSYLKTKRAQLLWRQSS